MLSRGGLRSVRRDRLREQGKEKEEKEEEEEEEEHL